jgi:hypothetical protein
MAKMKKLDEIAPKKKRSKKIAPEHRRALRDAIHATFDQGHKEFGPKLMDKPGDLAEYAYRGHNFGVDPSHYLTGHQMRSKHATHHWATHVHKVAQGEYTKWKKTQKMLEHERAIQQMKSDSRDGRSAA